MGLSVLCVCVFCRVFDYQRVPSSVPVDPSPVKRPRPSSSSSSSSSAAALRMKSGRASSRSTNTHASSSSSSSGSKRKRDAVLTYLCYPGYPPANVSLNVSGGHVSSAGPAAELRTVGRLSTDVRRKHEVTCNKQHFIFQLNEMKNVHSEVVEEVLISLTCVKVCKNTPSAGKALHEKYYFQKVQLK